MYKVSVCIPTYNQVNYIEKSIRSAYDQTLRPIEIIVSDDASTDGTYDLLKKLSAEIPVLKIHRQPVNLGIAGNVDSCLRLAKGEFITRLDSDDYLAHDYLEKLCELLQNHPNAAYAHAAVQEVDQHDNFLSSRTLARKSGYQDSSVALKAAKKGYRVAANIITFRKEALEEVNFTSNRPNYTEDYHLSASLAAYNYGNIYSGEILSFYRVWTDAGQMRMRRKLMEIKGLVEIFDNVLEPAYKERGWNTLALNFNRTMLACGQADCLGWDIYSEEEKQTLHKFLLQLSSSFPTKIVTKLYLSGKGGVVNTFWKFKYNASKTIKSLMFSRN